MIGAGSTAAVGLGSFVSYGWMKGVLSVSAATGTTTVMGPCMLAGGVMIAATVNQIINANTTIREIENSLDNLTVDVKKIDEEVVDTQESTDFSKTLTGAFSLT